MALLRHLLDEFALSFVASDAGLIVRTSPGAAAALAEGIDRAGLDGGRRHDRRRQHDPDPRSRGRGAGRAGAIAQTRSWRSKHDATATRGRRCSPTAAGSTPRSRSGGWASRGTRCTPSRSTSGQREDFDEVVERGKQAGAANVRVVDAVDRYAAEFLTPAIKANGLYERKYPMVSGLARPLHRRGGREGGARGRRGRRSRTAAPARGTTRCGSRSRSACWRPTSQVLAPIRDANIPREKAIALADEWGIPIASVVTTYSVDENLWGRTAECGPLEDPWVAPPEDAFERTAAPGDRPPEPAEIVVTLRARRARGARRRRHVRCPSSIRAARRARRLLRVRPGRHDREPPGRHQEPRALRGARRARDHPGAPGAGGPDARARARAPQAAQLEQRWADLVYDGQWFARSAPRSMPTSTPPRRT